jgi:alanine--tRNA ligase
MTSSEIRQSFLDFFREKKHTIVPSSSLMPDSPNLLFTNAGMNQFVPIFLGERLCPYKPGRAADTQKCIRAGGKHNDLDDVGLDTYHHTFFEMLGNWSFGDYFKKEAIEWAWELVVERWKFPAARLYATVYKPGAGEPSEFDQEAHGHWARLFEKAGLDPAVHIVNGNKKDNFWMMGDTGPCGPCSELHVDLTPEGDTRGSLVNKGDARCIEIWNLVFIQFNANPDGTFSSLPAKHVDTGMGFERVTSIIQGTKNFSDFANAKISNYETDIFRPIFDEIEHLSGKKYGSTLPGSAIVPTASVGVPPTESSERDASVPKATYYKRRLPYFERPWAKYMVSFSTRERRHLSPQARDIVLSSLLFGHEQGRYQLYAACVMPDHVHFLFEPQIKEQDKDGTPIFWPVAEILHSIKSFTAHEINKLESSSGQVWENESFDRMIRSETDLEEKFHYICRNPWDSGTVGPADNYLWLWTPDIDEATRVKRGARSSRSHQPASSPTESASATISSSSSRETHGSCQRDADNSGRDARAPHFQQQIQIDIAFRVIADHIRTLSFAIADGIQPGNTDRNYVLRRVLRRAVRYGRSLGFKEPFFYKLVDVLARTMGDVFPEIRAKQRHVEEVLKREEAAFNKTLDEGIDMFEAAMTFNAQRVKHGLIAEETISGEFAFKLYDTYGFPLDLTELMARERGLTVDVAGFEKLMNEQRTRARAAQKKEVISVSDDNLQLEPTKFLGYDFLETEAVVEAVTLGKHEGELNVVLDRTACYAEMGGQVGDHGLLHVPGHDRTEAGRLAVLDTQKRGDVFIHRAKLADGRAPEPGEAVRVAVDAGRRAAIQRHHTVTHLLHWALHEVVSRDATQKGSFVGADKLTFDFNSAALTPAQVATVEKIVNEKIVENAGVTWTEVPYAEVKKHPAIMQFFGDKYGDIVRVVQIGGHAGAFDGYSMELCGGTHTRATGEIGLFRIVAESAIAAGVRRIEAVAGLNAYDFAHADSERLKTVAAKLNAPLGEIEKKLDAMLAQQKELERALKAAQQREATGRAKELLAKAETINGIPLILANLGATSTATNQSIVDSLKTDFKGVIVLGNVDSGAVSLIASVSFDFTARVQAGKIIQTIAPIVGGKGGGKPDNARGGGKDAGKLDEALAKARALLS